MKHLDLWIKAFATIIKNSASEDWIVIETIVKHTIKNFH